MYGLEALTRALSRAPQGLTDATDETMRLIMDEMKDKAYRDAPKLTGTMARSIYWRSTMKLLYTIGAGVYYAVYVEYGTRTMRGRPFLRNAIIAYTPEIRTLLRNAWNSWITSRGE